MSIDMEYVRDVWRGRTSDRRRFERLQKFAYKRWEKTRDLHRSYQWLSLLAAIKRRDR